jgi:tRNA1(Val) A37 N6-methylase TrmN6
VNATKKIDKVNENITITQLDGGLKYGTDAFLLAAYMRRMPSARSLELGGGTGIISLLAASGGKLGKIYVCEIQRVFSELIEKNAAENALGDKVVSICRDLRDLKASDIGGEVDVVFSNPPYMKTDSGKRNETDEKYIARHEVYGDIFDFCATAARMLKFGGLFYCVYRPDRLSELMAAMKSSSLEPKRMTFVHSDTASEPSMVLIEAKRGAAPSTKITPPLIMYRDGASVTPRVMSEVAQKIYDTCSFDF